jgi:hypothetical protein
MRVVGDTPLLMHAWSVKAKKEMLDKQMKKATGGKQAKDPMADFFDSLYWLTDKPDKPTLEDLEEARFYFPSVAFKSAAVSAAYRSKISKDKVTLNGAFHILGDKIEIKGKPELQEDMVRIGMGVADIRYRGKFFPWEAQLSVSYNPTLISSDQITNIFNLGGFACGIGEWRVEKGGSLGMFHIECFSHN